MTEWIYFCAMAKLFWIVLQLRLGRAEDQITLSVTPEEADAILETATECGWRALVCRLLEERNA